MAKHRSFKIDKFINAVGADLLRDSFYALSMEQEQWDSIFGEAPEKIELCPGCPFEKTEKPCMTKEATEGKGREECSFYHRLVKEGGR